MRIVDLVRHVFVSPSTCFGNDGIGPYVSSRRSWSWHTMYVVNLTCGGGDLVVSSSSAGMKKCRLRTHCIRVHKGGDKNSRDTGSSRIHTAMLSDLGLLTQLHFGYGSVHRPSDFHKPGGSVVWVNIIHPVLIGPAAPAVEPIPDLCKCTSLQVERPSTGPSYPAGYLSRFLKRLPTGLR